MQNPTLRVHVPEELVRCAIKGSEKVRPVLNFGARSDGKISPQFVNQQPFPTSLIKDSALGGQNIALREYFNLHYQ